MKYCEFDNIGIIVDELNPFLIKRLQQATGTFKDEFKTCNTSSQFHERLSTYNVDECIPQNVVDEIELEVRQLINIHEQKYKYFSRLFNFITELQSGEVKFELERIWVNIQRKGEFLPIHNHSGIYSFVVWVDVPFNIEDEIEASPNPKTEKNRAGYFQFIYTDVLGKITTLNLPVDKKWEGRICLFPSELYHQVYPFYSSNDVRISIAGNIRIIPYDKL